MDDGQWGTPRCRRYGAPMPEVPAVGHSVTVQETDSSLGPHCCHQMARLVKLAHDRQEKWPPVLNWIASWDEYQIPVATDRVGQTMDGVVLRHCPLCGTPLRESKMRRWLDELRSLGFNDPTEQDIPEAYTDERWWRGG